MTRRISQDDNLFYDPAQSTKIIDENSSAGILFKTGLNIQPDYFPHQLEKPVTLELPKTSNETSTAADRVFQAADTKRIEAESLSSTSWKTGIFSSGDIFSCIFLTIQGINAVTSIIANAVGDLAISMPSGVIGGAMTCIVGGFDLIAGIDTLLKASTADERLLGWRLVICGISEIIVGALMAAMPFICNFAPDSTFGLILHNNPWILPALFAIPTFLFFIELLPKITHLLKKDKLAQELYVDEILNKGSVNNDDLNNWREKLTQLLMPLLKTNAWEQARELTKTILKKQAELEKIRKKIAERDRISNKLKLLPFSDQFGDDLKKLQALDISIPEELSKQKSIEKDLTDDYNNLSIFIAAIKRWEKQGKLDIDNLDDMILTMNILESSMQIEAALAVFDVYRKPDEIPSATAFENINSKLHDWTHMQWMRVVIQLVYLAAFIASMSTLNLNGSASNVANASVNFGLAGANVLPLYLDVKKPWLRNTPLVFKPVTQKDCPISSLSKDLPVAS